eukprot:12891516-Alexandrium_andersonii.AAC.1
MPSGIPPQGRGMRFGAAARSDPGLLGHFLVSYPWCVPPRAKVGVCRSAAMFGCRLSVCLLYTSPSPRD